MARVTFSGNISRISGSIGNLTHTSQGNTNVIKVKSKPTNRQTPSQQIIRNIINTLQISWQSLTNEQRQVWFQFASFYPLAARDTSKGLMQGQGIFIQSNFYRIAYNIPILLTPIFEKKNTPPTNASIKRIGNFLLLQTEQPTDFANVFIVLKLSPVISPSVYSAANKQRLIIFNTINAFNHNITIPYLNVFSVLPSIDDNLISSFALTIRSNGRVLWQNKDMRITVI